MTWISVKDRLPLKSGDYLVIIETPKSGPVFEGTEITYDWSLISRFRDVCTFSIARWVETFDYPVRITHWMPLPELPTVD